METADKSIKILSDITAYMKYAKYDEKKKRRELWDETVNRDMNMHIKKFPELKNEIEKAFQLVRDKKIGKLKQPVTNKIANKLLIFLKYTFSLINFILILQVRSYP